MVLRHRRPPAIPGTRTASTAHVSASSWLPSGPRTPGLPTHPAPHPGPGPAPVPPPQPPPPRTAQPPSQPITANPAGVSPEHREGAQKPQAPRPPAQWCWHWRGYPGRCARAHGAHPALSARPSREEGARPRPSVQAPQQVASPPSPSAFRWPPRCPGQTRCARAGWTRRRRGWTGPRARTRGSCPPGRWSLWRDCQGLDSAPPRHGYGYCSQGRTRLREEGGAQTHGRERKERPSWERARGGWREAEAGAPAGAARGRADKHMQGCLPPPGRGTPPQRPQHPAQQGTPRAPLYPPAPPGPAASLPPVPGSGLPVPPPRPSPLLSPPCGLPAPRALAPVILSAPALCPRGAGTAPH